MVATSMGENRDTQNREVVVVVENRCWTASTERIGILAGNGRMIARDTRAEAGVARERNDDLNYFVIVMCELIR